MIAGQELHARVMERMKRAAVDLTPDPEFRLPPVVPFYDVKTGQYMLVQVHATITIRDCVPQVKLGANANKQTESVLREAFGPQRIVVK